MDGSNVEYYAKLIRDGCEKAAKVRMQTTSNTLQNLCEKGPTIILKSIKIHPNSIQNASKFMKNPVLERDVEKTRFLCEKVTLRIFRFGAKSDPKRHPKIMKKSTPKKYTKMMAKGSKRDGKLSQHGSPNHENSIQKSMLKNHQTIINKT